MSESASPWVRRAIAALGGGIAGAVFVELIAYPALEAVGRRWELGAIPSLLSMIFFMPVLAGILAGLIQPARIYLTAACAYGVIVGVAIVYLQLDLRPHLLAFAISGWGLPLALWGALLVDAKPSGRAKALRGFRDLSYASACLMTVFAILPACVQWLPEPFSVIVAWVVPAAFFLGLAARNRRASEEAETAQRMAGTTRVVRPPKPWPP